MQALTNTPSPSKRQLIDEIEISNFKFFPAIDAKNKPIKVDGKHLLIYGENGSGKSSIFWALYTLLECANKNDSEIQKYFEYDGKEGLLNIHATQLPAPNDKKTENSYIKLKLKNSTNSNYKVSYDEVAINLNKEAPISNFASDFINYRALYSAFNFAHSEEVDLYHHFKYTVFPYVKLGACKIWKVDSADDIWKEIETESASEIIYFLENGPYFEPEPVDKRKYITSKKAILDLENKLTKIIFELKLYFKDVEIRGRKILEELGYSNFDFLIEIIEKEPLELKYRYYKAPKIKILLKNQNYDGKVGKVHRLHSFFNEAKLTAISLAIRLAILDKRTTDAEVKILVLDDLLLSLDMNNRTKVIDYVFKNYLNNYQVFFLTHDKALYAFVKLKINEWSNKALWEFKEMYAGISNKLVIFEEDLEPIEKAKKYKDTYDYYSSGNNIRKAIEERLKELLPLTIQIVTKDLQDELNWLFKYYDECKVGHLILENTRTQLLNYKDIVFNPASHYDLKSPIYLSELNKAFDIHTALCQIPSIKRTLLAGIGSSLFYTSTDKNYEAEYSLIENLYLVETNGNPPVITDPKHKCVQYTQNDVLFLDKETGISKTSEKIRNVTDVKISFNERCERIKTYLDLENAPIINGFHFSNNETFQQKIDNLNAPANQ